MTVAELESRIAKLEAEVARLHKNGDTRHPANVLDEVHGTFKNDSAFKEASRIGRKWRKSLDAKPRNGKAKRR